MTVSLLDQLRALKVVPIVTLDDAAQAVPLADAIVAGGLPCVEITFRTAAGEDAIRRIAAERPNVLAGAGTVLTMAQASRAKAAGARFVLAPGINPRVVRWCQDHELPIFPGVCTPTDIETALDLGLETVKIFPVEPLGGLAYLRAVMAPFPTLEFLPTGGITAANVGSYLALDRVAACGGSWMTPRDWIAAGAFDRVRDAVKTAAAIAQTSGERR